MSNLTWSIGSIAIIISAVVGWFISKRMSSTDHSVLEMPVVAPEQPPDAVTVSNTAVTTPAVPQASTVNSVPPDRVKVWATAQQAFEGWWPGSTSYTHNNPGNIKALGGGWLSFPTYEAGFEYLENYIRNAALGKNPNYPKGGKTTIEEYCHIYTGDAEPAPTNYAAAIARACGVPTTTQMSWLLE